MKNRELSGPYLRLITVELIHREELDVPLVAGPREAVRLIRDQVYGRDREHFVVVHLTAKSRVLSLEVVSVGSLTAALVHPREVFKAALLTNAAAIICAHNHPSGDAVPSAEDRATLRRLSRAARILGIHLHDFLVFGRTEVWSAQQEGLL